MTLIWFVVWLLADVFGNRAPLKLDPVNWWAGTLLFAIALDLSRQHAPGRTKTRGNSRSNDTP